MAVHGRDPIRVRHSVPRHEHNERRLCPFKNSEQFISLFKSIDGHTYSSVILGVFVGTLTTSVVQSSSAVVGIVIALASQGLVNFDGALAIVMGSNIGTTMTGILASIGGSVNAKRAALAQTLFKTAGVIIILTVFYPFKDLVDMITPGLSTEKLTIHIAMGHTVFNYQPCCFSSSRRTAGKTCQLNFPTKQKGR